MRQLNQSAMLLLMSLRGIVQRPAAPMVIVIGIACVVGVLVSMLSIGTGARRLALHNVRPDRAAVTTRGAQSIMVSALDAATVAAIQDAPGVKRDAHGMPLAVAYTVVLIETRKKSNQSRSNSPLFGVSGLFFAVYPEVRITSGRTFRPGVNELIVGKSRHELFEGLQIGDKVRLRGAEWTVVGHFSVDGGSFENALIADADTIASAFGRNSMQAVTVMLDSPARFATFSAALKSNPAIDVDVKHEAQWAIANSGALTGVVDFVSYFVGTVMAVGAILGALNVMYSSVDARKREIATLRAIGFGGGSIVVSVLLESVLLALPGALLGAFLAWLWFNGETVSPAGISIRLTVTPALIVRGIFWAVAIGLLGGVLPALRAARVAVVTALRAT